MSLPKTPVCFELKAAASWIPYKILNSESGVYGRNNSKQVNAGGLSITSPTQAFLHAIYLWAHWCDYIRQIPWSAFLKLLIKAVAESSL